MTTPAKPEPAGAATERVRESFVQLWGRLAPFWGISPSAARIHAWLLARAEPATADEISEGLALSRGAVSMGCAELQEWGLVRAERPSGARRAVFAPETDQERAVRNIVSTRKRREWDPILESLRDWIPDLSSERSADAKVLRERLRTIEALTALADSMASVFLSGGTVRNLGLKLLVGASRLRSGRARGRR